MRVGISGSRSGVEWPQPGHILECSNEEGAQLCASGIAVPVVDDEVETAVTDDAEKRAPIRTTAAVGKKKD
jgi:hypothetical protein